MTGVETPEEQALAYIKQAKAAGCNYLEASWACSNHCWMIDAEPGTRPEHPYWGWVSLEDEAEATKWLASAIRAGIALGPIITGTRCYSNDEMKDMMASAFANNFNKNIPKC